MLRNKKKLVVTRGRETEYAAELNGFRSLYREYHDDPVKVVAGGLRILDYEQKRRKEPFIKVLNGITACEALPLGDEMASNCNMRLGIVPPNRRNIISTINALKRNKNR